MNSKTEITKVEAIRKVLRVNGGKASLQTIYVEAKKYKKDLDRAKDWKAGLRGVLYREVRNGRNFKKVGEGLYALL